MSILNEKSVRKQVVRPLLETVFGARTDKVAELELTDYLLHQDASRLNEAVTGTIQTLTRHFGEDARNKPLAVEMVTSVFRDDEF